MSAALKRNLISVDEYLAGELKSPVKHEYLGGFVYAMAGARIGHNVIVGNIFASFFAGITIVSSPTIQAPPSRPTHRPVSAA